MSRSSSELDRPSQKKLGYSGQVSLMSDGVLRVTAGPSGWGNVSCCPRIPTDTAFGSVKPRSGIWQVAQEIVPSADRRWSKNNHRPSLTRAGVGGSGRSVHLLSIPSGGDGSAAIGLAASHAGIRRDFGAVSSFCRPQPATSMDATYTP